MVALSPLVRLVALLSICRTIVSSSLNKEATEATIFGIELTVVKISQAIKITIAKKPAIANVFVARSFGVGVDGSFGAEGCVVFIIAEATTP